MKRYVDYRDVERLEARCRSPTVRDGLMVTTAPADDRSNRAASTEFVQRAIEQYWMRLKPVTYEEEH